MESLTLKRHFNQNKITNNVVMYCDHCPTKFPILAFHVRRGTSRRGQVRPSFDWSVGPVGHTSFFMPVTIHAFPLPSIHSFIHFSIHSFIHSSSHLFIHRFIYSFIKNVHSLIPDQRGRNLALFNVKVTSFLSV